MFHKQTNNCMWLCNLFAFLKFQIGETLRGTVLRWGGGGGDSGLRSYATDFNHFID